MIKVDSVRGTGTHWFCPKIPFEVLDIVNLTIKLELGQDNFLIFG